MPYKEFTGASVGLAPKGMGAGRPYGPLIWIVWHTTEGSEGLRSAEDGNSYDARRTDGTSTHVFVDANSVVQEVNSGDRAWAALSVANNRGYQIELCARAAQTPAQWADVYSGPMLELAAQHAARVCIKHNIPPRWLTAADVAARRPGFLTHKNVTQWLEGTHVDPGPNFPAAWMANRVSRWIGIYTHPVPDPTPIPALPTGEVTMKVIQKRGEDARWKTDGFGREHVKTMAAVADLEAAFGKTVVVTDLDAFGPEVVALPVAAKVGHGDDTTDDSNGAGER
jgi:hypothetical protein